MSNISDNKDQTIRDLQDKIADLRHLATNLTEAATRSRDSELSWVYAMEAIRFISPEERGKVHHKMSSGDERPYESIGLREDGSIFPIEVRARHFEYKGEQVRVSAVRDLTEQKRAEEEIKTLRGILPICTSCKNVRDDKGYWNQIEAYIGDHSEAEFSHSICPECAKKLYPDYFDKGGNFREN